MSTPLENVQLVELRVQVLKQKELIDALTRRCTAKDVEFGLERNVWRRQKRKLDAEIFTLRKGNKQAERPQRAASGRGRATS